MIKRAITGSIFVAAVVCAIYFSPWAFAVLFGVFMLIGQWELYTLSKIDDAFAHKIAGMFTGVLIFASAFAINTFDVNNYAWHTHVFNTLCVAVLALFIPFLVELFLQRKYPFRSIGWTILGVLYVAVPFALLNALLVKTADGHYPWLLLGFFCIVWANDTGAYCVGKLIGKTKLFERVSPNKTWEGSIGGLFFGLGAAYALSYTSAPAHLKLDTTHWLAIGAITVLFGSLGDLVQSRMKRSLNVKDTGNVLPGHGGILDRFDAAIFAIPFVFVYLRLFVF